MLTTKGHGRKDNNLLIHINHPALHVFKQAGRELGKLSIGRSLPPECLVGAKICPPLRSRGQTLIDRASVAAGVWGVKKEMEIPAPWVANGNRH